MTFSVGPLRPQEVPALCELFQRVFGAPLPLQVQRWKYVLGPRLASHSIVARDPSGALLGHAGALVFPGLQAGRPLPMAQVCDVMVDSTARGGLELQGVYGRLMAALQADLARTHPGVLAYGFAGVRPYKLGARMGLYRAVQPCRMGRVADLPKPQGAGGSPPGGQGEVPTPLPWWRRPSSGRWPAGSVMAQAVGWEHPDLARLWARLAPTLRHPLVQRTPAYLSWRYAGHPVWRYQLWMLRRAWSRPLGWVVTREMPDGSLCIVDALLPPEVDDLTTARALADAMMDAQASQATQGAPPDLCGWWVQTEAAARLEPIMGCEVRVDRWHSDHLPLRFQPGDTDVF